MASIDPSTISTIEAGGIIFRVRELKIAGRRDITQTLKTFPQAADIDAIFDTLVSCVLKYAIGWDIDEPLTRESLESHTDVMDLIALLRGMALNGMLTSDDKKKSESQRSSSGKSSAVVAAEDAEPMEKSALSAQTAMALDAKIVTMAILPSDAQETFAAHSPMKSI